MAESDMEIIDSENKERLLALLPSEKVSMFLHKGIQTLAVAFREFKDLIPETVKDLEVAKRQIKHLTNSEYHLGQRILCLKYLEGRHLFESTAEDRQIKSDLAVIYSKSFEYTDPVTKAMKGINECKFKPDLFDKVVDELELLRRNLDTIINEDILAPDQLGAIEYASAALKTIDRERSAEDITQNGYRAQQILLALGKLGALRISISKQKTVSGEGASV